MSKVSIIIPTLNEERFLPNLLQNIKEQTFKDFEVIVSDANSTDNTRKIAESFSCKIVDGGIPSIARNNGAKIASGETLVFIDSDNSIDPNFLKNLLNEFEKRKLDLGCCKCNTKKEWAFKYKLAYEFWNFQQEFCQYTFFPLGSSQVMIIKKELFDKLGGFKEDLKVSEDIEFIRRVARLRYKFRVMNTKYIPSPRRFEKHGIFKTNMIGFLGAISVMFKTKQTNQDNIERLYGGWEDHKKDITTSQQQ